ncbi:helix-turn-helix domain-containing protein [Paenimyroides aestuarii]|uniref:AraC family transcriptional regulator n=1 Tax=Paenimyroides aestuarii TaxID=2968490 RepID=A0ABY5NUX6_9FLAO|nr:AraC family transcriptional regulator [Paenimyroides aestuarii]UUV22387.1 AraC family transcriptional regulator [Paenimyroides aestuarii]
MEIQTIQHIEIRQESDFPTQFFRLYHTHLLCEKGKISFLFNDQKMECIEGEFLFWFAESRLSGLEFSPDFKAQVLLVEKAYLMDNVPDQSWSIDAQLHSRTYPVKTALTEVDRTRIRTNFQQLYHQFTQENHRFYEEMLRLQTRQFILEMWHTFANEYERRKHSLQTGNLYERFMKLIPEHCMTQRQVQFYADQLHITPKHLNYLCKTHSGVTASAWIQRFVKERIIILLQNKHLNSTEIAHQMDFSSNSFFTRYVKKLLGVTPTEFRERMER